MDMFDHFVAGKQMGANNLVRARLLRQECIMVRSHCRNYMGFGMSGKGDGAQANSPRPTLHKHRASSDWPCHMYSAMGSNTWNAETCTLLKGNLRRKRHCLLRRDHCMHSSRTERSVTLCAEAPHPLSYARCRDAFANHVDRASPVAVGYHPWKRHPNAKLVLAFLHIAGVNTRRGNTDTHLASVRLKIRHLPNNQHVGRRSLLFVPSRLHI